MSRDFFQRQEDARRQSRRFFKIFAASAALAVAVFYLAVTGCLMVLFSTLIPETSLPVAVLTWQWPLPRAVYGDPPRILALRPFLIIGSGILLIITSACFYKIRAIKNGGSFYVAVMLGGRLLEKPATFKERQLVNVVEEMALAAGLSRPEIFIMDQEPGINAVTAGLSPEDAVISVTAGALEHLDRGELQGVVAHEFAHILNGDCALNLTMAGWLYGLLVFHALGKGLLGLSRHQKPLSPRGGGRGTALLPILGLILMSGGWLGKLFAELVQAALSRTRELLADAGAVQFTRNPKGLAGALKKITFFPGALRSGQALALQSFFFASLSRGWSLFRTHPPLSDRIWALTPDWDGQWPDPPPKTEAPKNAEKPAADSPPAAAKHLADQLRNLPRDWSGATLLALAGGLAGPPPNMAEAGRRLFESLPEELRAAAQDQAPLLAAAVFIQNEEPETLGRQSGLIQAFWGGAEGAKQAAELSRLMNEEARLPLLSLAAPALKRLKSAEKERLCRLIQALIAADGRLSLFEVAAAQILKKSLGLSLSPQRSAGPPRPVTILEFSRQLQSDAAFLLSALAHTGADDPEAARAAFQAGAAHLSSQWPPLAFRPRAEIKIRDLPPLLDRLGQTPGQIKNRLAAAVIACAWHDHKVTPREYELVRALAAALDRPLPLGKDWLACQTL